MDIDLTKLLKDVGKLDKKYGVDLHNPDYYQEPDMYFQIAALQWQEYLYKTVAEINCVDSTNKAAIVRLSSLDWRKDETYDVDSLMYRCRFLTLLLTSIADNAMTLPIRVFNYYRQTVGIYEHAYFYLLDIQDRVTRFTTLFLQGDDWKNLIIQMLKYTILITTKKKKRATYLIDEVFRLVTELREGSRHGWFTKPAIQESILVYDVMRLTIMVCSGCGEESAVPDFKLFENKILGQSSYKYELAFIGKAILRTNEEYKEAALLYRIFNDASPDLEYQYPDINQNTYLNIGCRAVEFVKFILNDRYTSEIIDKMMV